MGAAISNRGQVVDGFLSGDIFVASETWWALVPSTVTAADVTINTDSDLAFMLATAVAVTGANLSAPWDPSGSLPAVATHLSGAATIPSVSGVTTTNANDIVLFFQDVFSVLSPLLTGPPGFTQLSYSEAVQAFIGLTVYTQVSSEHVSSVISETLTATSGAQTTWIVTADAVRAA